MVMLLQVSMDIWHISLYRAIITTLKGRNSLKKWPSEINCSSEYINYRMFKTFLQLGNYLLRLSYQQRTVMRFRCRNVVVLAFPRNLRVCALCDELGDELGDELLLSQSCIYSYK